MQQAARAALNQHHLPRFLGAQAVMAEDPGRHGPVRSRRRVMAEGVGLNQPAAGIQWMELIRSEGNQLVLSRQLVWICEYRQQCLEGPMTPTTGEATGNQRRPAPLRLCMNPIPHRFELERKEVEDHGVFRQQMQHVQATAGSGQALAFKQRQVRPRRTKAR
jgi:hypothetical protein